MVKRVAHNLALALLFTASVIPVAHRFNLGGKPASGGHVVVAISGGDPEPPSPGVAEAILALLGLA